MTSNSSCTFIFFFSLPFLFLPLSQSLSHHSAPTTLHSHLGSALFLPLFRTSSNSSLPRQNGAVYRRELVSSPEAHARMTLHDDLLTKGYYTSRLWIGTPPQEFALIVDTGSTVTYVPCSSCTHCGRHQDPSFNPKASSSYKPVDCGLDCMTCDRQRQQCKYERHYAEMSTSSGLLGNDLVSFGNDGTLRPQRLVFGCETAETGDLYEQKADGIVGLGRGPLSIVDQLVGNKAMANSFSLCYGGMDEVGGAMIMGAVPRPPGMVFTKSNFEHSAYYNLGLQEIRVAGTPLPVDPRVFDKKFGTVLDSGTTFAYFPEKAFLAFKKALTQHLGKLHQIPGPDRKFPDVCFQGAGNVQSQLTSQFPQVDLKFGDGKIVSLAPENYLFKHAKVPGAYCLGIFNNGKDSATLLGGIIVRNMLVTYDRANRQIGFWKTKCTDLWNNLRGVVPSHVPSPPPPAPVVAVAPKTEPAPAPRYPGVAPGPARIAWSLEVEMLLRLNYTAFNMLTSEFLEDLSQGLHVDINKVNLINVVDCGMNVSVLWAVVLADTDDHLLNNSAEKIIAHLEKHEIHFSKSFQIYRVTRWTVNSMSKRSRHSSPRRRLLLVFLTVVVAVVIGMSLLGLWYFIRYRNRLESKYVAVEQQNIEVLDQL